jgi:hypothetical protein
MEYRPNAKTAILSIKKKQVTLREVTYKKGRVMEVKKVDMVNVLPKQE